MASQSIRARVERAHAKREAAVDAVYAAAYPRRDVVFSECRKLASPEVLAALESADRALGAVEDEAIAKRRAWRSASGAFTWYS